MTIAISVHSGMIKKNPGQDKLAAFRRDRCFRNLRLAKMPQTQNLICLSRLVLCAGISFAFTSSAFAEAPLPLAGSVTASAPDSQLWQGQNLLGAYHQPQWVKSRRFATTRVHIQRDPWEVAVEQWGRGRLVDGEWSYRFQEEIEIGLPGRFQLDFYRSHIPPAPSSSVV